MKGIGVSSGIAIGRALVIKKSEPSLNDMLVNNNAGTLSEIAKFDRAIETSVLEVEGIVSNNELNLQEEEIGILRTQIEFLSNPQIRVDVVDKIQNNHSTAHDSLILLIHKHVEMIRITDDKYINVRAADIQDIGNRILRHLDSSFNTVAQTLEKDTIIIAEDISPSDTIAMDLEYIIGFATVSGSKTSHTAILAKTRRIPAVVRCGERLSLIKNNDIIILDGRSGHVLINPDTDRLDEYIRLRTEHIRMTEALKSLMDGSAEQNDDPSINPK